MVQILTENSQLRDQDLIPAIRGDNGQSRREMELVA